MSDPLPDLTGGAQRGTVAMLRDTNASPDTFGTLASMAPPAHAPDERHRAW